MRQQPNQKALSFVSLILTGIGILSPLAGVAGVYVALCVMTRQRTWQSIVDFLVSFASLLCPVLAIPAFFFTLGETAIAFMDDS